MTEQSERFRQLRERQGFLVGYRWQVGYLGVIGLLFGGVQGLIVGDPYVPAICAGFVVLAMLWAFAMWRYAKATWDRAPDLLPPYRGPGTSDPASEEKINE